MRVFARIDHAALALQAGLTLLPTELLIFGNPRAGTPMMQESQTIGIDLPRRYSFGRIQQERHGLHNNDPGWLARRHGITSDADRAAGTMALALAVISRKATGDQALF